MEKPWCFIPKSPADRLWDRLAEIIVVHSKIDNAVYASNIDNTSLRDDLESVLADCHDLESALRNLHRDFESTVSGPLYWSELSRLEINGTPRNEDEGNLFPVSSHFSSFIVTQFTLTYWSGTMVLYRQLANTYQHLAVFDALYSHRCRDATDTIYVMVTNICQSFEYLTQSRMGGMGLLAIISPLRAAQSALKNVAVLRNEDLSREADCVTGLIGRTYRRFNFDINLVLRHGT